MEKKLFTDCLFINFILTEKLKGVELYGLVSISHVFKRCETKGDKVFFFANDEEFLKITFFNHEKKIIIVMDCENTYCILHHQVEKNNFNKIKKFFSEVEKEINGK